MFVAVASFCVDRAAMHFVAKFDPLHFFKYGHFDGCFSKTIMRWDVDLFEIRSQLVPVSSHRTDEIFNQCDLFADRCMYMYICQV